MAVTTDGRPRMVPLPQQDPRLPVAIWIGNVEATGDATGGNLTARVLLALGFLYSYEELMCRSNTAVIAQITAGTGLSFPGIVSGPGLVYSFSQTFRAADNGAVEPNSAEDPRLQANALIFDPDIEAVLLVSILNGAGRIVQARGWGYVWSREALKFAGGPLRPRLTPGGR